MAGEIRKSIYYRSVLNVLDVVETCPRNLKKEFKENEYRQALAILEYNSQWVDFKPLEQEIGAKLIKFAKKADKRERIREIIAKLIKKGGKPATVEEIIKMAGE